MKFAKVLGLVVLAMAVAQAFVGSASATVFTSPPGTVYTGLFEGESEGHVVLHSENAPTGFTIECNANASAQVETHGTGVTVTGVVKTFNITNCTNGVTILVQKFGTFEAHAEGGGNANLTHTGGELVAHVPLGFKCIYTTNKTALGTLTGGTPGTVDLNSATITRTGGSAFCGTGGFLTGSLSFTTPASLSAS